MAARSAVRSKRQPSAAPEIDWVVTHNVEQSKVDGAPIRVLNFSFRRGRGKPFRFALPAEEAYELREDIGRAYDQVN